MTRTIRVKINRKNKKLLKLIDDWYDEDTVMYNQAIDDCIEVFKTKLGDGITDYVICIQKMEGLKK